uniref:Uncharacterized protein n=1 Tax=Manihot esculenta TaxID=3983 RepID=A0A2C9UPI2_MANES
MALKLNQITFPLTHKLPCRSCSQTSPSRIFMAATLGSTPTKSVLLFSNESWVSLFVYLLIYLISLCLQMVFHSLY